MCSVRRTVSYLLAAVNSCDDVSVLCLIAVRQSGRAIKQRRAESRNVATPSLRNFVDRSVHNLHHHKHFCCKRVVRIWNNLECSIIDFSSLKRFKTLLFILQSEEIYTLLI